nr:nucleoside triphosphate pyrophosphohydrolase [uncultured Draconibacterium sp.]
MDYNKYITFETEQRNESEVGNKSIGFYGIKRELLPKYVILNSALFELWKKKSKDAIEILDDVVLQINHYLANKNVILRSSASNEDFEQRGYYESSRGNIEPHEIKEEILKLWTQNYPLLKENSENHFSVIIQIYIVPKLLGHLSNERRLSKSKNKWYYEILNNETTVKESNHFTVKGTDYQDLKYSCRNKLELINVLKGIASLEQNERIHYEWVWDGLRIWVVQKDIENTVDNDEEPGSIWKIKGKLTKRGNRKLNILKTIYESTKSWKKVDCVKTFNQIDLPTGEVYIIENKDNLEKILNKNFCQNLIDDLEWLLSSPIVIRIDLINNLKHTFLLPRTETLFKVDDVKKFLHENTANLEKQGVDLDNICFLLHRFIISKSCALAYSKPKLPRTRIDSTWGIVDGLYYHPHDSFEYNSSNKKIRRKIRCKTEYLDIDETGGWISKKSNDKYDWRDSLTINEIEKISYYNEKLASYLDMPVTVMYFVGVFPETGYSEILPWFYTTEEIPESSEKFSEIIFAEKKIIISTQDDFENIKNRLLDNQSKGKITIQLKLRPSLLRDRDILEEIGAFSKSNNVPIELEGSILSHPYYILKKCGAIVKPRDIFAPEYPKQDFYKLVRDKIPILIKSKGEHVKAIKINSFQTLELIKQKLIEEAYECFWENDTDHIIEELADIYELLRGAANIFDITIDEISRIADKKKEKRGGFDESVFLIETKEESLIEVKNQDMKDNVIALENVSNEEDKESFIPSHKESSFSSKDSTLSVPYVPALIDSSTKKRIERISINSKEEYKITFKTRNIEIQKVNRKNEEDENQLKLDL